jgi:hypothetical protein
MAWLIKALDILRFHQLYYFLYSLFGWVKFVEFCRRRVRFDGQEPWAQHGQHQQHGQQQGGLDGRGGVGSGGNGTASGAQNAASMSATSSAVSSRRRGGDNAAAAAAAASAAGGQVLRWGRLCISSRLYKIQLTYARLIRMEQRVDQESGI